MDPLPPASMPPSLVVADRAAAKPLIRMISKLMKPKGKSPTKARGKGITTSDVHINERKLKFW